MRFLVDEPVSWEVARELARDGHDAIHVIDCQLTATEDEVILQRAAHEDRIIITQDTDFGTLLATTA